MSVDKIKVRELTEADLDAVTGGAGAGGPSAGGGGSLRGGPTGGGGLTSRPNAGGLGSR